MCPRGASSGSPQGVPGRLMSSPAIPFVSSPLLSSWHCLVLSVSCWLCSSLDLGGIWARLGGKASLSGLAAPVLAEQFLSWLFIISHFLIPQDLIRYSHCGGRCRQTCRGFFSIALTFCSWSLQSFWQLSVNGIRTLGICQCSDPQSYCCSSIFRKHEVFPPSIQCSFSSLAVATCSMSWIHQVIFNHVHCTVELCQGPNKEQMGSEQVLLENSSLWCWFLSACLWRVRNHQHFRLFRGTKEQKLGLFALQW